MDPSYTDFVGCAAGRRNYRRIIWSVIKKGKAYTYIEENEAGIPQVKRYTVVWE